MLISHYDCHIAPNDCWYILVSLKLLRTYPVLVRYNWHDYHSPQNDEGPLCLWFYQHVISLGFPKSTGSPQSLSLVSPKYVAYPGQLTIVFPFCTRTCPWLRWYGCRCRVDAGSLWYGASRGKQNELAEFCRLNPYNCHCLEYLVLKAPDLLWSKPSIPGRVSGRPSALESSLSCNSRLGVWENVQWSSKRYERCPMFSDQIDGLPWCCHPMPIMVDFKSHISVRFFSRHLPIFRLSPIISHHHSSLSKSHPTSLSFICRYPHDFPHVKVSWVIGVPLVIIHLEGPPWLWNPLYPISLNPFIESHSNIF